MSNETIDYMTAHEKDGSIGVWKLIKERFTTDRERRQEVDRMELDGWGVIRHTGKDNGKNEMDLVHFRPPS